ncbi:MAG: ATP-dependent Clp protease adapter ClpS [Planctomycetota bacterium]|jgi:ATP-dependent Clp protease adaptor protein ClpS
MSEHETGPGTSTVEETRTDARLGKPWNVIVHDDPINLMVYVTHTFMRIFGYPRPKAEQLMMEVHQAGRSVVWTGGREQAEVYTMKLHAAHLHASMEQVED